MTAISFVFARHFEARGFVGKELEAKLTPVRRQGYLLNLLNSEGAAGAGALKKKLASKAAGSRANRIEHDKPLTIADYRGMVQAVLGLDNVDNVADRTRDNLQKSFPDDQRSLFMGRIAAAADAGLVVSYPEPKMLSLTNTATRGWALMTLHQVRTIDPSTLTPPRSWNRLASLTSRWLPAIP